MKKTSLMWVIGIVVVALVVGGIAWSKKAHAPDALALVRYTNATYGISFMYPQNYFVTEKEVGNGERRQHLIMLVEDIPGNRDLLEGKIVGEGPTAITFDVFQNNFEKLSAVQWIKGNSNSNFKLSDGTYKKTTVAGAEAVSYTWDGLYRGDSTVFEHKQNIIMATVTYLESDDDIRAVFGEVMKSVSFSPELVQ